MVRPVDHHILSSRGASVGGGVVERTSIPSESSGNVLLSEGWIIPGWMPFH